MDGVQHTSSRIIYEIEHTIFVRTRFSRKLRGLYTGVVPMQYLCRYNIPAAMYELLYVSIYRRENFRLVWVL